MVDVVFPYLKYFKSVVLRNYWPSIDRIGQIKVPILFIMTVKDEIVPFSQMAELFSKAPQNPLSSRVILFVILRSCLIKEDITTIGC
jgi:fermentation-respiration switch protein FrsA (DUF1100 family)